MKTLVCLAIFTGLASAAFADIQDPPSNDYGPTRKLGRGISNLVLAPTEFFTTVNQVNQTEGNSAGASYGVWKGAGRAAARPLAGFRYGGIAITRFCRRRSHIFTPAMRNFRLRSVTNPNIRTCATRTTISIRLRSDLEVCLTGGSSIRSGWQRCV
jgi:putative exosortase-associated protein (TIGR04073 family)